MNPRLLAKPFVLIALMSLIGCSKKDDLAPTNTGTYTLSGVTTPCQVTSKLNSGITDYLDLRFTPTDPQHSGESVLVSFVKPVDASAYELSMIVYSWNNEFGPFGASYFAPDASATLTQLSSGAYSGTFSATFSRFAPSKVITAGAFTNVRL